MAAAREFKSGATSITQLRIESFTKDENIQLYMFITANAKHMKNKTTISKQKIFNGGI